MSASAAVASHQQIRKPYTITKQRERWTEEEHSKFLEALKLYGRAWRRIEEYIGTKTAVQIRSHAQKFFSKLEREQASGIVGIGQGIEVPPPRPKRKPSHPYPKKAGLSSSHSISDRDTEFRLSSNFECSSKPKSAPPARSLSSLKLFGVVLDPAETASPPPATTEEESAGESGVTSRGANSNSRVHHSEVSSRDHEAPGQDPQREVDVAMATQPLLAAVAAGMQIQDQVALSNLIALHYASFLASFRSGADCCPNPWQLLDPQKDGGTRADIIRWHSVTDSSSPCADKSSTVTRVIGRKRPSPESAAEESKRRKEEDEKCCSSSVTASSVDKEGDEEAGSLATTLRLEREDNDPRVGGFVRLCRPMAAIEVLPCTIQQETRPPFGRKRIVSSKREGGKEQAN